MQVDESSILSENGNKSIRRRKKQLYNSILHQMEFYFSDANLRKDRFIGNHIKYNPYVDVSLFLTFNKISTFTNKVEDIIAAIEKSEILKLSEDKTKVCRITPLKEKENEDECTIYVERLPEDTQHDWLQEIFSTFGKVEYVSVPKYKHNKRHKGFAFVEFDVPEAAKKAIEYFEIIGCKLPTKMPPSQLISIATFESENTGSKEEKIDFNLKEIISDEAKYVNTSANEKKNDEVVTDEEPIEKPIITKKRKLSQSDNDSEDIKKVKTDASAIEENSDKQDEEISEKKKRRRKKVKKHSCDFKQIGLRILSKREWKQLRNKYLNMQRTKMKTLKDHLHRNRCQSNEAPVDPEVNKEKKENKQPMEEEREPRFKFSAGCIIGFTLSEPCSDIKKFKADLKTNPGVEYVDIGPEYGKGFIRFSDSELAKNFSENSSLPNINILDGEQEKEYWNKITADRKEKLKKTGKKVRGREKLLKKAEQELGKHIRFEN